MPIAAGNAMISVSRACRVSTAARIFPHISSAAITAERHRPMATAELDPGINGTNSAFNQALHDELCKDGPDHCPTMLFEKGESHMSEVFSIDTSDKVVSGPILKWMKSIK